MSGSGASSGAEKGPSVTLAVSVSSFFFAASPVAAFSFAGSAAEDGFSGLRAGAGIAATVVVLASEAGVSSAVASGVVFGVVFGVPATDSGVAGAGSGGVADSGAGADFGAVADSVADSEAISGEALSAAVAIARSGLRSGRGIGSVFAAAESGAAQAKATRHAARHAKAAGNDKWFARMRFISSIGTGYDLRLSGQDVPRPGSRDDKGLRQCTQIEHCLKDSGGKMTT